MAEEKKVEAAVEAAPKAVKAKPAPANAPSAAWTSPYGRRADPRWLIANRLPSVAVAAILPRSLLDWSMAIRSSGLALRTWSKAWPSKWATNERKV